MTDAPTRAQQVRRAYVCDKCLEQGGGPGRVFVRGDDVPKCPRHGKMQRQPNAKYRGKKTPA